MKVLKGARIIDGTGAAPLEKGVIVLDQDKLVAVGREGEVEIPDKAQVLDLTGKTVMPGLIDSHVHLCFEPTADPFALVLKDSDAMTALRMARNAQRTLQSGVTTVRDLGGKNYIDLDLRHAIGQGIAKGPRILASGKVLTMTGGHGWPLGCEVDGVEELRKGARQQLKAGVDVVKVMATGGVMTPGVEPGSPQLSEEEMRAAIEEANKAGKRTATHAQGTTGIKNAIRAGINSIEHGIFLDDEAVSMMLERGVYYVPTLVAPYWILTHGRDAGIPEHAVAKTERVIKDHNASFRLAHKAGVKIAMGTDAGTPFNEHGKNWYELKLMVQEGMTPMEAIMAATKTSSELLGISDQVGTLVPGKKADLLVLNSDPLANIEALADVNLVFKDGQTV